MRDGSWKVGRSRFPLVIGTVALTAAGFSLFNDMCRKPEAGMESLVDQAIHEVERQIAAGGPAGGAGLLRIATTGPEEVHPVRVGESRERLVLLPVLRPIR